MTKRVLLAAPRGYCAGVDRAVITVEKALALYGAPVYVRKQIVHNIHVVTSLEAKGAIFVDESHEEVEGTAGEAPDKVRIVDGLEGARTIQPTPGKNLIWLSQTTLSVDETMETVAILKERFPDIQAPPSDDICYATQNRQEAIKVIASQADLVIVVGSQNSSNSVRLAEVALEYGAKASHLIDYAEEIQDHWFADVETIGVTSGASVPEILVKDVLATLAEHGFRDVQEVTAAEETLLFSLPPELRKDMKAAGQI